MPTPHTTASNVDEEIYFTNTNSEKEKCLDDLQLGQISSHDVLLGVADLENWFGLRSSFYSQVKAFARAGAADSEANTGTKVRAVVSFLMSKVNGCLCFDRIFLVTCFLTILFISAADTWFAVINDNILAAEMNPFCGWLLRLDANSCGFFIAGKACGLLIVFLTLFVLLRVKYRHARIVIAAVTLFQLGLFTHLCLSDPLIDGWINFQLLFDENERSIFSGVFDVRHTPL